MLLEDSFAGLHANTLQASDFMTVASDLKDDPSTDVIDQLTNYLQFTGQYLVNDSDRPQFESWVRATFGPVAEKMGWQSGPQDSDETRARRASLLTLMGQVGRDPKAIQLARDLMDKSLKGEPVDRTMLIAAIPIAARNGDEALYNAIIAHFSQIKTPEEGLLYGQALVPLQRSRAAHADDEVRRLAHDARAGCAAGVWGDSVESGGTRSGLEVHPRQLGGSEREAQQLLGYNRCGSSGRFLRCRQAR